MTPSVFMIPVDGRIVKHPLYDAGLRPPPFAGIIKSAVVAFSIYRIQTVRSNRKVKPVV